MKKHLLCLSLIASSLIQVHAAADPLQARRDALAQKRLATQAKQHAAQQAMAGFNAEAQRMHAAIKQSKDQKDLDWEITAANSDELQETAKERAALLAQRHLQLRAQKAQDVADANEALARRVQDAQAATDRQREALENLVAELEAQKAEGKAVQDKLNDANAALHRVMPVEHDLDAIRQAVAPSH